MQNESKARRGTVAIDLKLVPTGHMVQAVGLQLGGRRRSVSNRVFSDAELDEYAMRRAAHETIVSGMDAIRKSK
jgi:hypothetical protein